MAQHKIYMGGDLYIGGGGGGSAEISKEPGNALVSKTDGLYVPAGNVEISKESDNAIQSKSDGLYVPSLDDNLQKEKVLEIVFGAVATDQQMDDILSIFN